MSFIKRLLDKNDIHREIKLTEDKQFVLAALHEYPEGCLYWTKYKLTDLPNNSISRDDLERFGINCIDGGS